MGLEQQLMQRSEHQCELCGSTQSLQIYMVPPEKEEQESALVVCQVCLAQIESSDELDSHHWHCLNEAMWKPVTAIQVMAWRILQRLATQGEMWAQDSLDMLYLEDDILQWAQALETEDAEDRPIHKDSNGTLLSAGDNVTLIKDLDVKGANFTAKRGTLVKNITLTENPEQIEGKINGTQIVLLTKFLKKANA